MSDSMILNVCFTDTGMATEIVYHSTNCNESTTAFTNTYQLGQCSAYVENGSPLYYYGYTCSANPYANFASKQFVVNA